MSLASDAVTAYYALVNAVEAAAPLRSQPYSVLFQLSQSCTALLVALDAYIAPLAANASSPTDMAKLVAAKQARATFASFELGLQKVLGKADKKPVVISTATSLYAVAAQFYPKYDVVETAQVIAQANNLTTYFISAGTTLYLPPIFGTNAFATTGN